MLVDLLTGFLLIMTLITITCLLFILFIWLVSMLLLAVGTLYDTVKELIRKYRRF